jgi:sugar phosphate isomerase/epimerase
MLTGFHKLVTERLLACDRRRLHLGGMNGLRASYISSRAGMQDAGEKERRERLSHRLGLNVPYEWWPRAAALKAVEAAGFHWIQVASPPVEVLADRRNAIRHARALRRSLEVTALKTVVHGPTDLRLGSSLHNRAAEGLLEHAHELGASHVVLHALDVRKTSADSEHEERALKLLARWAAGFDLVVCVENLCSTYPGPAKVSHDPHAVQSLVRRCDSPAVRMVLDIGHANVVADRDGVDIAELIEPVLEDVALFHVHDNLGTRRRGTEALLFDPIRLDLHLPPGLGSVPWRALAPALGRHPAPLMLEIHPNWRPSALTLQRQSEAALVGAPLPANPPSELPPELLPSAL